MGIKWEKLKEMDDVLYEKTVIKRLESDIERLKKVVRNYKYDHLTGLMLRYDYENALNELWYEYTEYNSRFIYAIIDVNNLHDINHDYGHKYGDAYIVNIVNKMKEIFEDSNIYRVGGDEFVILKKGNRLKNFIKRLNKLENCEYGVVKLDDTSKFMNVHEVKEHIDKILLKKKRKKGRRGTDK